MIVPAGLESHLYGRKRAAVTGSRTGLKSSPAAVRSVKGDGRLTGFLAEKPAAPANG